MQIPGVCACVCVCVWGGGGGGGMVMDEIDTRIKSTLLYQTMQKTAQYRDHFKETLRRNIYQIENNFSGRFLQSFPLKLTNQTLSYQDRTDTGGNVCPLS